MIQSRMINRIAAIAMAFTLVAAIVPIAANNASAAEISKSEPDYAEQVFGTDILSVEISADEKDWQEMLDNAASEQFIMADVIVNGTKFKNVGIRPKGNSSLSQVAGSGSDRYSFRLQFDEYIKDQTCFGLKSFVLNNMLSDNTYMKEHVSYELMKEAGIDTPYFGFADIKVNGKAWGFYLAIELYNESYEQRVFGDTSGMLYNVKSMDVGGMNENAGAWNEQGKNAQQPPDGKWQRPQRNQGNQTQSPQMNGNPGGMGMGGRGGSTGGSLAYVDDNSDSYSAIFSNVVGKGKESDYQRVIKALKALSEGQNIEEYFDVDQILRYLAAHTFVVNLDSYSSNMAQNYYIYEKDGQIQILPWDYNMAWGGFQSKDALSVVNFPIDTPVNGVEMSARPLLEKLFADNEYLARYHSYLQQLIGNYFADGKFESKIYELDALISEHVKNDTSAFCTYEEYKKAVSAFITLGNLRAQSIQGQLDGTVPSTTSAQTASPDQLVSAGDLNLQTLGSGMGGSMGGGMDGGKDGGNKGGGQVSAKGNGFPGGNGDTEQSSNPGMLPDQFDAPGSNGNRPAYSTGYLALIVVLTAALLAAILITAKLKRKY